MMIIHNDISMRTLIFYGIILTLLFAGCGYHFKSRIIKLESTDYFTEIAVKNDTYEPGIDLTIKEYLTAAFTANGWMRRGGAGRKGSVFSCTITKFEDKAVSYTGSDDISQYELAMTFDVAIYKGAPRETVFSLTSRRYTEQYIVSGDIRVTLQNKNEAIKAISDKFSLDIEDNISEGF